MLRLEAQEDYFRAQAIFVADAVFGGELTGGGKRKGAVFETADHHQREIAALQKKLHLN